VYRYLGKTGKPDVISYGADGAPGGEGQDTDISSLERVMKTVEKRWECVDQNVINQSVNA
jgi:hypothetical protein